MCWRMGGAKGVCKGEVRAATSAAATYRRCDHCAVEQEPGAESVDDLGVRLIVVLEVVRAVFGANDEEALRAPGRELLRVLRERG